MSAWLLLALAASTGGGAELEPLTPPPPPPSLAPPPPSPPPMPPPATAPAPAVTPAGPESGASLAEEQQRQRHPRRFFDFGRGPDTAIMIGEVIAGGIAGGIIGSRLGQTTAESVLYALLGVPVGAALFGLGAAAFLRFAPANIAWLALMAGVALGLGAAGVAVRARWDPATATVGVILGMQLGLLALFLATVTLDNVSDDDTALIRMVTGNATYAAAAVMWLLSSARSPVDWSLLLFVPALAMAAASGLALWVEVPARVMDFMIGIPILASGFITTGVTFLLTDGFRRSLDSAGPAPAIVALSTWGGFMLVGLLVDGGQRGKRAEQVAFAPFLAPSPSGGVAFGAGACGRF